MSDYVLPNGQVLSDEVVDKMIASVEDESWWEKGDALYTRVAGPGRPPLSQEPNANLSFKCPMGEAALITRAAEIQGLSKSAFIRQACRNAALAVLEKETEPFNSAA